MEKKLKIIEALNEGLEIYKDEKENVMLIGLLMRTSIALVEDERQRNAHEIYGVVCQHLHREMESFVNMMIKLKESMEEFEKEAKKTQ